MSRDWASTQSDFVEVRALTEDDRAQVVLLDDRSGNFVEQWLDDENFGWGLFKSNLLVGYCTIGYADDCCQAITDFNGWTPDSLLLSDVFVVPEERHKGLGAFLVNESISKRTENEKELVFLTRMYGRLSAFYEKCGFVVVDDIVMVRDERESVKTIADQILAAECLVNKHSNKKKYVKFER